jgi:hypothetical protein
MKKKQLIQLKSGIDVLKFYLILLSMPLLFSCSPKNSFLYSPCQEKCRYMEQDCMDLCRPEGVNFSIDYGSGGIAGVSSCSDRCGEKYNRCLYNCSLEQGDGK